MKAPRGIRNNNPGNIEKGEPWKGTEGIPQTDSRFATFRSPEYGIRAIVRILMTYQRKHKLHNIRQIISRWAPNNENNTESYINAVSNAVGLNPDEMLDVRDYKTLNGLVRAIIKHENGKQPYSDDIINAGLALGGVTPENSMVTIKTKKQIEKDKGKAQAGVYATATGGAGVLYGGVTVVEQIDRVHNVLSNKSIIFIGICAVACFGFLIYQNRDAIKGWFNRADA